MPGKPVRGGGRAATGEGVAIDAQKLQVQPLALRRRIVRAVAEDLGLQLEQQQVEDALALAANQKLQISAEWGIQRSPRELRFERVTEKGKPYFYPLSVPGEVTVGEMNIKVRASLKPLDTAKQRGTLVGQSLSSSAVLVVQTQLAVRSWRAGDRFRQAHAAREHKVKELLHEIEAPASQRSLWPVIEVDGEIVWLYGARNPSLRTAQGEEVVIEVVGLS
jgi:tRNA(Ile)-lysidine synthetase-like protein